MSDGNADDNLPTPAPRATRKRFATAKIVENQLINDERKRVKKEDLERSAYRDGKESECPVPGLYPKLEFSVKLRP